MDTCLGRNPPVINELGGVTTNPSVMTYNQWLPFPRASGVTTKPSVTKLPWENIKTLGVFNLGFTLPCTTNDNQLIN
jgi:hypothetical protein